MTMLASLALAVLAGQGDGDVAVLRAGYAALAAPDEEPASVLFDPKLDPAVARTVLEVARVAPRLLVERIDTGGTPSSPGAVAVVGYARAHARVAFFRDRWRKADGSWRLFAREPIAGKPPLRFKNALMTDVLRALDNGTGREWLLEGIADERIDVDLTGLDFDAALPKVLRAADAKPYRLSNGLTWFVPRVMDGPYDQTGVVLSSVEFSRMDVREACRWIFARADQAYTADSDVTGEVTLSLLDANWENTLQEVTRRAHATYRCEGGVFQIVRREEYPTATKPR